MPEFEALDPPITIGVVADTHIASHRRSLPADLLAGLTGCDVVFHAGDICVRAVLDELAEVAPVFAVHGNCDDADLFATLPDELRFRVGPLSIGLLHGHLGGRTAKDAAFARMHRVVDVVVYGHSHIHEASRRDGLLMVNPGSPTQPRFGRARSFARLHVDASIRAEIVLLQA